VTRNGSQLRQRRRLLCQALSGAAPGSGSPLARTRPFRMRTLPTRLIGNNAATA
jgi:hypothetical protein